MANKSIGQFIATLRKANGMTQKQLAEKLNVSDKAVSRWEREESAPDLSLIPVIAEIFGVTSDEILRGERKPQPEMEMALEAPSDSISTKSVRQVEHLLNNAEMKLSIYSIISGGISLVGFIGAMIGNFGFYRAYIGFYIAAIFYLIATVCEMIFAKLAFSAIRGDEFQGKQLDVIKKKMTRTVGFTYGIIIVLFAITLPLITLPWDSYVGLAGWEWLEYGVKYGIATVLVGGFVIWAAQGFKKEAEDSIRRLRKHYIVVGTIVLVTLFAGESLFINLLSANAFGETRVFTSIKEFEEYMETPSADWSDSDEAQAESEAIYNESGTMVAEYIHRNTKVNRIEAFWQGGKPNITVYIGLSDLAESSIILCWVVSYPLAIVVTCLIYRNKKQKLLQRTMEGQL